MFAFLKKILTRTPKKEICVMLCPTAHGSHVLPTYYSATESNNRTRTGEHFYRCLFCGFEAGKSRDSEEVLRLWNEAVRKELKNRGKVNKQ